jgi:hypothetical protein
MGECFTANAVRLPTRGRGTRRPQLVLPPVTEVRVIGYDACEANTCAKRLAAAYCKRKPMTTLPERDERFIANLRYAGVVTNRDLNGLETIIIRELSYARSKLEHAVKEAAILLAGTIAAVAGFFFIALHYWPPGHR